MGLVPAPSVLDVPDVDEQVAEDRSGGSAAAVGDATGCEPGRYEGATADGHDHPIVWARVRVDQRRDDEGLDEARDEGPDEPGMTRPA